MICKTINQLRRSNFIQKTTQMKWCEKCRYVKHFFKYVAPAKPHKIIYINPDSIEYANLKLPRNKGRGQICSGDWDQSESIQSFDSLPRVRSIKQRFERGYEWEETDYYKQVDYEFENPPRKHKSPIRGIEEYYDRFEYIDALYEDMKSHGFVQNHGHVVNKGTYNQFEPLIAIDRDGDFIFNDGRHRITIAQVLNLKKVPVHVLVRHRDWQKKREKIHELNSFHSSDRAIKPDLEHPDFNDLD